ncbi:MAG: type II toxin-antitoxin system HicB family antitoxin [Lachnospiraceae bacterium]|nr:type II toxin-antitoxin system HicB family antitoxin [Lachnospiraceae bacterium]
MKLDYPVIVSKEKNDYIVYVPDLDVNTFGSTFDEAIDMAYDAIGMVYMTREDKNLKIKKPSKIDKYLKDKNYKDDIVTHVSIDPVAYRQKNDNISVRRNVTIPGWLDKIVRKNRINVSEFLQNMLRRELRV